MHGFEGMRATLVYDEMARHMQKQAKEETYFLANFRDIIRNLPDCLDIEVRDVLNISSAYVDVMRRRFESRRYDTVKRISKFNTAALLSMGLTQDGIEELKTTGQSPPSENGAYLDVTVDHIRELGTGGNNSFDNLCLMPQFLNAAKGAFIINQLAHGAETAIMCIVPRKKNNRFPKVPIIPKGFRPEGNGATQKQRVTELFGYNLL